MTKHRIFLADDHVTVRAGLKTLLNAEPDLEVVGEAADGPSAIEEAKRLRPEVAVIAATFSRIAARNCPRCGLG